MVASVGIHAVAILSLLSASPRGSVSRTPIMDELVQPKTHKILIYDLRRTPRDVEPLKKVGNSPRPRGAELSKQAVIATSRKPKSSKQMIWLQAPKIQIQRDVPMPNLIARMKTSHAFLPTIPEERPRPKIEAAKADQPNPSPPEPKLVRTFAPPPAPLRQPKLPLPIQVSELPAAPSVASPTVSNPLPPGAGIPSMLPGLALPTSIAPVAPVPSPGDSKADIAIASLHPAENAKAVVPDGGRPGRFSKAPETGSPATGDIGKSAAVVVPDLTVREDKTKPVRVVPDPTRTKAVLYTERVRSVSLSTLSVPLRPSSRTIPRAVDARFQGRNVYIIVVPIENMPAYGGDWIVWFAERQTVPGKTPLIRAPVPFRKMEPADETPFSDSAQARVLISAVLDKDGRLSDLAILTRPPTISEQAVVQDLASWEFKPATHEGAPVEVEVVIEIPFNLATAVAKRKQP
ncbi:MAG: energy transducer TonB [Bryobacteraceae bacterium]